MDVSAAMPSVMRKPGIIRSGANPLRWAARKRGIGRLVSVVRAPSFKEMTITLMPPAPVNRGAAYAHARRPSDCRATARSRQIAVPRNP